MSAARALVLRMCIDPLDAVMRIVRRGGSLAWSSLVCELFDEALHRLLCAAAQDASYDGCGESFAEGRPLP
jgi:hypothetical protein